MAAAECGSCAKLSSNFRNKWNHVQFQQCPGRSWSGCGNHSLFSDFSSRYSNNSCCDRISESSGIIVKFQKRSKKTKCAIIFSKNRLIVILSLVATAFTSIYLNSQTGAVQFAARDYRRAFLIRHRFIRVRANL